MDRSRFTRHTQLFWLSKKQVSVSWETGGGREGVNVLCNFNRVSTPPVYERERKRDLEKNQYTTAAAAAHRRRAHQEERKNAAPSNTIDCSIGARHHSSYQSSLCTPANLSLSITHCRLIAMQSLTLFAAAASE